MFQFIVSSKIRFTVPVVCAGPAPQPGQFFVIRCQAVSFLAHAS